MEIYGGGDKVCWWCAKRETEKAEETWANVVGCCIDSSGELVKKFQHVQTL